MADRIVLTGVEFTACHGVLPEEKTTPQPFVVDAVVWLDFRPAAGSDDLRGTVSYVDLATIAEEVIVAGPPRDLIETLATVIVETIMERFPVLHAAEVTVHKPQAPIGKPFADVAVVARRSRKRMGGATTVA
ncbi:dihydroneopterin aldolase [Corynebacterium choanae]|uniref:7,8-dihydroneopterin aldolase n=1 Tax=Corynebacterium choanae TaxID=1862358 RepID=A0A3G6J3T8_9CORY|nr:dihydroneopterin aldolase [Corynebacterium choanae]AZA12751.1 putative dihydroneopterin aldolase [Corynebacterium choanae]